MTIQMIDVRGHRARIGQDIDRQIANVVEHGKWIMGPEVSELEQALGAHAGGTFAVGCSNGTDALVLALQALSLQPGEAVICPTFTFVATAEAVAVIGGVPVFADVELDTFNTSAHHVRTAIAQAQSAGLRVAGIVAVDLFGLPAPYADIKAAADEVGAWVIADAAQSFGGMDGSGQPVGSLATITTTSFFPAKPLGCYGDGGALFTEDEDLAQRIRSLQVHGKGFDKYDNVLIGQNSRLDTIQAAILLPKLAILNDEIEARDAIARAYSSSLEGLVKTPLLPVNGKCAWAQYTIRSERRDELKRALTDSGIGNAVYYPKPLHCQSAYSAFVLDGQTFSNADQLATTVLSLPMHPYLSREEQGQVVATLGRA